MYLTTFGVGLFFVSCSKEEISSTPTEQTINAPYKAKPVIYHASWDEWGRTSRDCKSWGLCNFEDCWFCDDGEPMQYSGEISDLDESGNGKLTIKLKPEDELQRAAILGRLALPVDENIVKSIATIFAGDYIYKPEIGEYGGYELRIKVN